MSAEPILILPAPAPDQISAPFYSALRDGRLLVQRCGACGVHDIGRLYCDACDADSFTWVQASGRGHVHSFVVMHISYDVALAGRTPYIAGSVELEEGARLFAQLLTTSPAIGQAVSMTPIALEGGGVVPAFKP